MSNQDKKRVVVTGAAGFIGRAVVARIDAGALGPVSLRINDVHHVDDRESEFIHGSFADPAVRARLTAGGVDLLFHLASLPGGAAQRDPQLGRQVNLDGTIALLDAVAGVPGNTPKVVYASSIAALGHHDQPVTDATALRPAGAYGTHKAMVELYLADVSRQGLVDGRSVRLAGIVARPPVSYGGFATAWMSDLFHAALEGRAIQVPVRASAHVWLQSVDVAADNIIHAARVAASDLPPLRAWTLPATVVRVSTLADALERRIGRRLQVDYGDSPTDHPPLETAAATAAGFISDDNVEALVDTVLASIDRDQANHLAGQQLIP